MERTAQYQSGHRGTGSVVGVKELCKNIGSLRCEVFTLKKKLLNTAGIM